MNSQLLDCGKVHILADENKDLAVFSFVKNPEYVYDSEPNSIPPEWPPKIVPLFYSKTAFELKNPYTIEELAAIIKKGTGAWDTLEPYISRKKSIEEFYYKIDGFKKATFGKKLLVVDMESNGKKRISISLPVKAG